MIDINDYEFKKIIESSKSYSQVYRKMKVSGGPGYKNIKKRISLLNLSTNHFVYGYIESKFDYIDLKNIVKDCFSYLGVIRKTNLNMTGGNYITLKRKIKEQNIDISHFTGKGYNKNPIKRMIPMNEILIKDSTYRNRKSLKSRLIKDGYFERKCYNCNLKEWLNGLIPIQLEHKNGDNTDHRIENLTFLCPNCHALTDTYCGKNKKLKNNVL